MLYNSEDLVHMTRISKKDILHLANLSGLSLTQAEVQKLTLDLTNIINFFEELQKVDTSNILATSQTTNLENITRDDVNQNESALNLEDALFNASDTKNNLFKVPIILKK